MPATPRRQMSFLVGHPARASRPWGRQDVTDQRNALWQQYVEAVHTLRPKFFVLENVREFLRSEQFGELVASCGAGRRLEDYEIEFWVLDSSLYGAPQRRRRAILIGRLRGLPLLGEPPQRSRRSTVRDAFEGLRAEVRMRDLPDRNADFHGRRVLGPFVGEELHVTRFFTQLSLDRYRSIPPGGNRFDLPYRLQAPCWRAHRTGSADVMGRLVWDKPSVTIRTEFFKPEKGRYLHPEEDRPLTHLEAGATARIPRRLSVVRVEVLDRTTDRQCGAAPAWRGLGVSYPFGIIWIIGSWRGAGGVTKASILWSRHPDRAG